MPTETLPQTSEEKRSTDAADPTTLPHIKPSKVKRYLSRSDKHEAFSNMDPDKMLEYIEQNQKINDEKKKAAQAQKWYEKEGGEWQKWGERWYWCDWRLRERWSGPY